MTEQLKQAAQQALEACPFCGSPARLNRSTGESLWSHDQVEWTQVQCTNEDCGVATENHCEGWEPTPIESWNTRALTAAQPAQAGEVDERAAFIEWLETTWPKCYPKGTGADYWRNGHLSALAWKAARASLPTQPAAQSAKPDLSGHDAFDVLSQGYPTHPADCRCTWCKGKQAAQATPEPVGEPIKWWNGCDKSVPDALRFLANNPRPAGGSDRYNAEHLFQLAGEIERMARQPLFTHPAPGVPDVEAAAKKLAECMDYPWEHMPSAGRDNMRKHAAPRSLPPRRREATMTDHNEAMRLADELVAPIGTQTSYQTAHEAAALLRKQATARALDTFAHNVLAGQARLQMVQLENKLQNVTAERDTLRAEVERLRVDAERYLWLADCNNFYEAICLMANPKLTAHTLGAAIDNARKATP